MPTLETYLGTILWHYVPNMPLAIVFTILFCLVSVAHAWKMFVTKTWFCIPFLIGGIFEVIGYISRAAATNATGSLIPYIFQAIFILLAPVCFAASLYMVYSRVVRAVHGDSFSLISPRWATVVFVSGDWTCLNIQSSGSGLLVHPKQVAIGTYIIVAGLALQVLMFVVFMFCCLNFNSRFRAHVAESGATSDVPWQACLNMLYSTSLAILVRNIYRVVEYIMGKDSYLQNTEWPTYVFDAALMFLVMIGFFIWYPSQLRPTTRDSMIELTADGESSAEHGRTVKPSMGLSIFPLFRIFKLLTSESDR
ncbi:protein RTA1 [Coleophoma cylindrospora]|uniref:Protein RTA1 n=1 Tax=Coleophoma cylindrospora TaxID=1849047 RepID=A0A3D8R0K4_9HELO|nr:protein RTA1 [Coleophoma cylindrospora]